MWDQMDNNIIILGGPSNYQSTKAPSENCDSTIPMDEENVIIDPGVKFVDLVKIDGKTIIEVSAENMFYEEIKPKRKSRWGFKQKKKHADTKIINFSI